MRSGVLARRWVAVAGLVFWICSGFALAESTMTCSCGGQTYRGSCPAGQKAVSCDCKSITLICQKAEPAAKPAAKAAGGKAGEKAKPAAKAKPASKAANQDKAKKAPPKKPAAKPAAKPVPKPATKPAAKPVKDAAPKAAQPG